MDNEEVKVEKKNKVAILILVIFLVIGLILIAYSFYYLVLPRANATIVEVLYRKDDGRNLPSQVTLEYKEKGEVKTFVFIDKSDENYKVNQEIELILTDTPFSDLDPNYSFANNEGVIVPLTVGLMFTFVTFLLLLPEQKQRAKADFQGLILGVLLASIPLCFIWLLIKIILSKLGDVFTIISCTIIALIAFIMFVLGITTITHYLVKCCGVKCRACMGKLVYISDKNIHDNYKLVFELEYKTRWFNRPDFAVAYVKDISSYVLNKDYKLDMPIEMKCDSINLNRKTKFSANINALIEEIDIKEI